MNTSNYSVILQRISLKKNLDSVEKLIFSDHYQEQTKVIKDRCAWGPPVLDNNQYKQKSLKNKLHRTITRGRHE